MNDQNTDKKLLIPSNANIILKLTHKMKNSQKILHQVKKKKKKKNYTEVPQLQLIL